jgi:hypothetical protein
MDARLDDLGYSCWLSGSLVASMLDAIVLRPTLLCSITLHPALLLVSRSYNTSTNATSLRPTASALQNSHQTF